MKNILSIIVLTILSLLIFNKCSDSESDNENSGITSNEGPIRSAYSISQNFVKQKLNYPVEADFPWTPISKEDLGDNIFKVRGEVTAKNGFGVKTKYIYTCVMEFSGIGETADDSQWKVTALYFDK